MARLRVLLFGGTDLSHAVAARLSELSVEIVGIVYVGERFSISYSSAGVENVRHYNLSSWAEQRSIPAHAWTGAENALPFVREVGATWGLAAGWYHLVPRSIRDLLELGCAGIHASLLPKLRGGAPLNWAILSGAKETGVTLFALADGVDDGPVLGQRRFPVGARTSIAELVDASTRATVDLLSSVVLELESGELIPAPQTGTPSYCLQRIPDDGWIDWTRSAVEIDRLVRAVGRPYPGAFSVLDGERITIWASSLRDAEVWGEPGQLFVLDGTPAAVTGDGILVIDDAADGTGESATSRLRSAGQRRFDPRR